MNDKSNERRQYFRLDSRILSWYKLPPDENLDVEEILGRVTKNIGEGGLLVEMDECLPISTILNMDLKLPNEKDIIKAKVRVIRAEELGNGRFDIGFAFAEISEEDRNKINAYIKNIKTVYED